MDNVPLPFPTFGGVKFQNQAQFNPLEFVSAIVRGLRIYEHTRVRELIGTKAITDNGNIKAKRIIVATHFPFINKHGAYYLKMFQHRSYVIALQGAPQVDGMYVDEAPDGLSFRNYGNLLLIGGGDHRTGKKGGGWGELRSFAKKHFPGAVEKYHWATQDYITLTVCRILGGIRQAGKPALPPALTNGGMTSSMVAATLLTDMLCGKSSPYEDVFILRAQFCGRSLPKKSP